ncbi:DUF3392 domain-containing protein [Colwellia sp. M166]|jgi:hypothetical protein|uniref:DUF3392 domain-containing protein n=1 Tax=Colwellia sp. M166 TaxID=2583805 RepID=UPI00211DAEB1|nr:DUF3392 domain-containing protein [Colwellia sp. M166]UUO25339.1 DUF3392 domain-containing protein [Colwellia sp. M166]|tara:strand:+ start:44915 stop:45238 length:324 start_codon:yes stop_codon:yes gene_type:complete
MTELVINVGQWFRGYQYQTAMAIVATVLVIFGNDINSAVRKLVAKQHFIIRCITFIVVCAFGYGLLTVWLTRLLSQQLSQVPNSYVLPLIVAIFSVLGVYAQKRRHI